MKGVGVNERYAVAHDGDMAFPEDEVAAPQKPLPGLEDRRAERGFLHVAIARADAARGGERDLDEARAIETERGLAAPQIRHAEKALRHGDEIRLDAIERREMRTRYIGARAGPGQALVDPRDREPRAERQRLERRQLDRRARESERAQRCHFMSWWATGGGQGI